MPSGSTSAEPRSPAPSSSEAGEIIRKDRRRTPAGDPAAIVENVVALIESLSRDAEVSAAGIAAAGFIDVEQSTVYYAPNINWRSEPLRDDLSARLPGLRITVDNDANAAGWAEYRFGAGRGTRDMTMLTIGTGVGGAIVSGGRLFRGGFGAAGEIGHVRVVPGGLPCGCGQRGCIEQYGSGRALLRMANDIADAGGIGQGLAEVRRVNGELDGGLVAELIATGDPGALAALRELGGWLGQAARLDRRGAGSCRCSCSAAAWPRQANCCSSRSARRISRTCPLAGSIRSRGS